MGAGFAFALGLTWFSKAVPRAHFFCQKRQFWTNETGINGAQSLNSHSALEREGQAGDARE